MNRLQQPASSATRALLGELLDVATRCAARLENTMDNTALHDFRVALRRLRANQRAYSDYFGGMQNKRLRRLTRATNAARDREVQLEWLRQQRKKAKPDARHELDTLIVALEYEQVMQHGDAEQWHGEFIKLAQKMRRRLKKSAWSAESGENFAAAASTQLHKLSDKFQRGFTAIESQADDAAIHVTRIICKRLRYLVEPVAKLVPEMRMLIRRLKALQDLLGEIHDCQIRLDELANRNDKEHADCCIGLQGRTAARRVKLLADMRTRWLEKRAQALFLPLERVINRMRC